MQNMIKHLLGNSAGLPVKLEDAFVFFLKEGLINIGEAGEITVSNASKVARCSRNTAKIDLVSGVQIKTAQTYPDKGQLEAYIAPGNTKAPILVNVVERSTLKEYYFYLQHKDYYSKKGSSIRFPFKSDGTPKRDNHWWEYEITFNEYVRLAKNVNKS